MFAPKPRRDQLLSVPLTTIDATVSACLGTTRVSDNAQTGHDRSCVLGTFAARIPWKRPDPDHHTCDSGEMASSGLHLYVGFVDRLGWRISRLMRWFKTDA
jgi:hypothetical protein